MFSESFFFHSLPNESLFFFSVGLGNNFKSDNLKNTSSHEFMIDLNQRVQTQITSKAVWGRMYVWDRELQSEVSRRNFKLTGEQRAKK